MVAAAAATPGTVKGIEVYELPPAVPMDARFAEAGVPGPSFSRVDLVFRGIDHSSASYEVRIFFNNREATDDTPESLEDGFAGDFTIFGHGGCFGDVDHCEVTDQGVRAEDLRYEHPMKPVEVTVDVTDAYRYALEHAGGVESVTLVPMSQAPRRADRGITDSLWKFADWELRTYQDSPGAAASS
jgi:hypothetical protein